MTERSLQQGNGVSGNVDQQSRAHRDVCFTDTEGICEMLESEIRIAISVLEQRPPRETGAFRTCSRRSIVARGAVTPCVVVHYER